MSAMSIRRVQQGVVAALALAVGVSGACVAVAHADQQVGRYAVKGQIEVSYFASGGTSTWGAPISPERVAPHGGRYQDFARDTSFYWHPGVDGGTAHQVGGAIRAAWAHEKGAAGPLGYPTSDELRALNSFSQVTAAYNQFQGGVVYWSPTTGAHPVWGEILVKWTEAKREAGQYGYPIGDEVRSGDTYSQKFQRGTITWP
ncbi:lysozyme [Tsukamurella sp. 8F]|uniref:LGFP repeat-containing protein n=1 Tax=unclassified Tsukamurella TaxID=2633480 RepID=UPI0023B9BD20|nr:MULTISPECIES: lysozyme [unclassified Tsukamurella]MDF0529000.1 lysozyme [Tsukamurella sp. 8J]MDF0587373.1 lysozyme [Tsukamurella sp. 8F]